MIRLRKFAIYPWWPTVWLLLFITALHAEEEVLIPKSDNGPIEVGISVFILDIPAVDDPAERFEAKVALELNWRDQHLAFDPQEVGYDREIFTEDSAWRKLNEIWWPDLEIVNEYGEQTVQNEILTIYADGLVTYWRLLEVTLTSHLDLSRFPFDMQQLVIEIESPAFDQNTVAFVLREDKTGYAKDLVMEEWRLKNLDARVRPRVEIRSTTAFSNVHLELQVERKTGYYVWKVFLPLVLIIAISWSVFWMSEESVGGRMNISLICLLAVVAFGFTLSDNLPKISYLTFTDAVVAVVYCFMALTIAENIVVHTLKSRERETQASSLDRSCRWLFPLVYLISWGILIVMFL